MAAAMTGISMEGGVLGTNLVPPLLITSSPNSPCDYMWRENIETFQLSEVIRMGPSPYWFSLYNKQHPERGDKHFLSNICLK